MDIDELKTYKRRLGFLKVQAAYHGINCRPEILMEIEDIEKHIDDVDEDVLFASIMNRHHLLYLRVFHYNTLKFLFKALDDLEPNYRHELLMWIYMPLMLHPKFNTMEEGTSLKDILNNISYEDFKSKCYLIAKYMEQGLLVLSIITFTLQGLFSISDKTHIDDNINKAKEFNHHLQSLLSKSDEELEDLEREYLETGRTSKNGVFTDRNDIQQQIDFGERIVKDHRKRVDKNYSQYVYFCENIVAKLLNEEFS